MCTSRIIPLILCFQISICNSFAFNPNEKDSSSNVISYYNDLNLKLILNTKYNNFIIENEYLPNSIHWKTNDNNNIGIGGNYKWFGLNLLFNIPAFNDDDEIYGNTSSFNLIGNIYTRKIILDAIIQDTKGFYLENPQNWYQGWTPDQKYPINSSLNVQSLGVHFLYVYDSEEFSLKSSFILNERQIKSAGSVILGSYFNVFSIDSDSSFIPFRPDTIPEYELDIREASYANLGAFAGYSHNFIFKKYFFISITGALGLAFQNSNIQTHDQLFNIEDRRTINAKFQLRTAAGYSNDNYFASLSLITDSNGLGRSVNYNFGYARLTFGHRLKLKKRKPDQ